MFVVDACMVCIEGGVITALHHQITNLTHTRYTKGMPGWRRNVVQLLSELLLSNEWFSWQRTLLQAIENSLFIHAFSAEQCLVKPPAMYHLQIVAPLMPPACTAEHLMPPLHPSWCSCGDFKEFRGNVRLCFRPPTVALNECHRVAAAADIWTFCGRGHYSSDNLCRR